MFQCELPELKDLREIFTQRLEAEISGLAAQFPDALQLFRGLLPRREITPLLAKLAYDVLKIFDATPMLLVNDPTIQPA